MIRGYCIGGGLLTALQADIRIAADDSQFGVRRRGSASATGIGGVEQLVSWSARRGPRDPVLGPPA